MSFNLLEMVKSQVGDQLLGTASKFLGESEEKTGSAISAAIPALLGGIASKGASEEGAKGIMDMIGGLKGDSMGDVAGLLGGGTDAVSGLMNSGGGMLSSLLGNKLGGITSMISAASGLGSNSSSSLLKMAAPLVMGVVGKKVMGDGMGVSGLMSMLSGQADNIKAGMSGDLGGALGSLGDMAKGAMGSVGNATGSVATGLGNTANAIGGAGKNAVSGAANVAGDAASTVSGGAKKVVGGAANLAGGAVEGGVSAGKSLLKWLVPGIIVLLGLGFLARNGCNTGIDAVDNAAAKTLNATEGVVGGATELAGDAVKGATDLAGDAAGAVGDVAQGAADLAGDAAGAVGDVAKDAVNATGELLTGAFGNINAAGKAALDKISFAAGSVGSQMNTYIAGGGKGNNLFKFKELNFATSSANIDGKSMNELNNLASILTAYSDVKIAIEGHTDNRGNAAMNQNLSTSRAASVKEYLTGKGIDAARMSTQGFGSSKPATTNDTAEGRAQNRRIEVRIVK